MITNEKLLLQIQELYIQFSVSIKPLISAVESLLEKFPEELYNEVRAFNDHMVRCFATCKNEQEVQEQIKKAKSHLTRITLDCYKCLNVGYRDLIEDFQKKTKYVDLTVIDNGHFSGTYNKMYRNAVNKTRDAKNAETTSPDVRYELYAESYLAYVDLYNFIIDNTVNVNWARARSVFKKGFSLLGWLIALILSAVLANNNQAIVTVLKSVLGL